MMYYATKRAVKNGAEVTSVEWGTIEQGNIERKVWIAEPAEATEGE